MAEVTIVPKTIAAAPNSRRDGTQRLWKTNPETPNRLKASVDCPISRMKK
jgi:hypothetical protein